MSILDKAKELSNKVTEKVVEFSSDELIADTIIKAVEKQEKVNLILQEKGCLYRVNDLDLEMGIPPTLVFGIRRLPAENRQPSQKERNSIQVTKDDKILAEHTT